VPNNISDIWSLLNKTYNFVAVLQTHIFAQAGPGEKK
jgi:hypothetical protein